MSHLTEVEKVARAICRSVAKDAGYDRCDQCDGTDASVCREWERWTGQAIAALEALEQPTERMLLAGFDGLSKSPADGLEEPRYCWQAMLRAALGNTSSRP
jgi:hypothetical protein